MAVEWTITIEGRNEFGGTCRKELRIDKTWESLFNGDIGLSIGDGNGCRDTLLSVHVHCVMLSIPVPVGRVRVSARVVPGVAQW